MFPGLWQPIPEHLINGLQVKTPQQSGARSAGEGELHKPSPALWSQGSNYSFGAERPQKVIPWGLPVAFCAPASEAG